MIFRTMPAVGLAVLILSSIAYGAFVLGDLHPRSVLEERFQKVINEAQLSDTYGWNGPGWDRADVSQSICDDLTLSDLQGLGMAKQPFWPIPTDGRPARPIYQLEIVQDWELIGACADGSRRALRIQFDAETLVCSASVQPFPSCDL